MKLLGLFPGQGSQAVNMVEDVMDIAQTIFQSANSVLNFDLLDLIVNGPIEKLTLTKWAQPAILSVSYAYWLKHYDKLKFDCLLGHSLGELTALLISGVINFETAVYLAHKRGEFMQDAVPEGVGGMTAIIYDKLEEILGFVESYELFVANYNTPSQIVVAGLIEKLIPFEERVKQVKGAKMVRLQVSAPFHTPLLMPAREKFFRLLEGINFSSPKIPVISNAFVKEYPEDPVLIKNFLADQIVSPVRFIDCLNYAVSKYNVENFIEIGYGTVLTGLIRRSGLSLQPLKE